MSIEPIIDLDSDKLVPQKSIIKQIRPGLTILSFATSVEHKTMVYNLIGLF